MKFCERRDTFHYSWNQVARAFWFRYPNPFSKHVQTEDIISRKVEKGILYTKRLLTKNVKVSYFGCNWTFKQEPIIEESYIDPKTHIIKTTTWNIGTTKAVVTEECFYKECGEQETAVERKAWIASSKIYFSRAIESYLIHRFKKNISKTSQGLQFVLENMFPSSTSHENKTLSFIDSKDKICEKAKKAKELATSKAVPIFVACAGNKQ